jgi:hypothetical protein
MGEAAVAAAGHTEQQQQRDHHEHHPRRSLVHQPESGSSPAHLFNSGHSARPGPGPRPLPLRAASALAPCRQAVGNAPASSAMTIPVKRSHPPAQPDGDGAAAGAAGGAAAHPGSSGDGESGIVVQRPARPSGSEAGPGPSGRPVGRVPPGGPGSGQDARPAGRAGAPARPQAPWQEQRGWWQKGRPDSRKPGPVSATHHHHLLGQKGPALVGWAGLGLGCMPPPSAGKPLRLQGSSALVARAHSPPPASADHRKLAAPS